MRFQKTGTKSRYPGLQGGMKLSLAANWVLNWLCAVLSFSERLQLITAPAMCTEAINVLAPRALNPDSQYFIPLFSKISLLCWQQPWGHEAAIEVCNSGPRHDITDNSNILYINSLSPSVRLRRQFCVLIRRQNQPLHFLWQNRFCRWITGLCIF